ncbi:ribosomal protein L11 methyltransferase [Iodidimonas gelatinilytica]|uniref:Ribosomal protein L11 methyltransferase n=1 Tax=Iodidimonas gelatinilytica TaxID=1236966 RepID=A0A5A7N0J1_9PROT|nr:50S ribosomal protein L11 methyltransferase [Iodidimonas gelatinilytica]GER01792.1 ribosomal protein L11 methyltransferase [Iodidimonas gelatinilytica]
MSAWHVWTTAPMAVAPALETLFEEMFALDACPPTISSFEVVEDHIWRIEAYFDTKPDLTELVAALDAWRDETGHQAEDIQCEALEDRDWVSESQKLLSPVTAGKLFVHGSHDRENRRAFGINLQIEAGQAFGTGQHATTMGCLLMLDRLARRIDRPQAMLDLGCGSGVLAMAMGRLWRKGVLASDIDPIAMVTTRENAVINDFPWRHNHRAGYGLAALTAPGMRHRAITSAGPFDLVTANILAAPLVEMAADIAKGVAPGGRLILAGLLARQERRVANAYRARGFLCEGRLQIGDWPTLLMRKAPAQGKDSAKIA